MGNTVFIVGAGFSLEANRQFESILDDQKRKYPLVPELGMECFDGLTEESIESQFADAIAENNYDPIRKLVNVIFSADYFLGSLEAQDINSLYHQFLDRFVGAQFISFNYDSLLELLLFKKQLWYPTDGFGVKVEIGSPLPRLKQQIQNKTSAVQVIHLHGTVLLYNQRYGYEPYGYNDSTHVSSMQFELDEPKFKFDADKIGRCFRPYNRVNPGIDYVSPEFRIVAPTPGKSDKATELYLNPLYSRSQYLIEKANYVIAIGYSFADCDQNSYAPLIKTILNNKKTFVIVDPQALKIKERLEKSFQPFEPKIVAVNTSFQKWAKIGFPY